MSEPQPGEVIIPEAVLAALLDIYDADQEGMAYPESYDIVRAWDDATGRE